MILGLARLPWICFPCWEMTSGRQWVTRLPQPPVRRTRAKLESTQIIGAGWEGLEGKRLSAPIDQSRIVSCRYGNAYQYAVIQTSLAASFSLCGRTTDLVRSARRKHHFLVLVMFQDYSEQIAGNPGRCLELKAEQRGPPWPVR